MMLCSGFKVQGSEVQGSEIQGSEIQGSEIQRFRVQRFRGSVSRNLEVPNSKALRFTINPHMKLPSLSLLPLTFVISFINKQ